MWVGMRGCMCAYTWLYASACVCVCWVCVGVKEGGVLGWLCGCSYICVPKRVGVHLCMCV
jgi:hypothetical protein